MRLLIPDVSGRQGRSTIEWLLIAGLVSFFLWPFLQLWSVKAMPLLDSDIHQRASQALENILAKGRSRSFLDVPLDTDFNPLPDFTDIGLEGRLQIRPHPEFSGLILVKAQVRWGMYFFRKILTLEAVEAQTRP